MNSVFVLAEIAQWNVRVFGLISRASKVFAFSAIRKEIERTVFSEIIKFETNIYYYRNERLHREDGPAIIQTDGREVWYRDGVLHRENGPALKLCDGSEKWYSDGELHRDGGPAVKYMKGPSVWYHNGKLHRDDGPAIESNVMRNGHLVTQATWFWHGRRWKDAEE